MSIRHNFFLLIRLLDNLKPRFFIFEQINPKPSFLHHTTRFFIYSFNYLCNIFIFAFYIALDEKRMVGCYTLNDHETKDKVHEAP